MAMQNVRKMSVLALGLLVPACEPPPDVVRNPTWAEVEPILRGACNHCHGSTARVTGANGQVAYRLDFYDVAACGDAAPAMTFPALAHASAASIRSALTVPPQAERPRMPPAPAQPLLDWQRETLLRWANNPVKGAPPGDNRPPHIRAQRLPAVIDNELRFTAVLEDPNGESVIGVIRVADKLYKMDRSGAFAVVLDASSWDVGDHAISATLCDSWGSVSYELGAVRVSRP